MKNSTRLKCSWPIEKMSVTQLSADLMTDAEVYEAQVAREQHGFIGFVFDHKRRERYDLIRLLGYGSYGRVFSAGVNSEAPRYAIKVFLPLNDDGKTDPWRTKYDEPNTDDVELEYGMGRLMAARLGSQFCSTRVVCPLYRFYAPRVHDGVIIFPFVAGINLERWLTTLHYPKMQANRAALQTRRFENLVELRDTIASIQRADRNSMQTSPNMFRRLGQYMTLLDTETARFASIQRQAFDLSIQALRTVEMLHSVNIYHRDIKPANMLVEVLADNTLRLRLIDFGLGCAQAYDNDPDGDRLYELNKEIFNCPLKYITTVTVRDPLAARDFPNDEPETISRYTRAYEVYALAKLIQRLFDHQTTDRSIARPRASPFMPPDVYELISVMTGETGEELYEVDPDNFQVPEEGLLDRLYFFQTRPSVAECRQRMEQAFTRWLALPLNEYNDLD